MNMAGKYDKWFRVIGDESLMTDKERTLLADICKSRCCTMRMRRVSVLISLALTALTTYYLINGSVKQAVIVALTDIALYLVSFNLVSVNVMHIKQMQDELIKLGKARDASYQK